MPDSDLPLLAARWLTEGWESELLVELAGMARSEAHLDAHRLLPLVLSSLGFDASAEFRSTGLGRYTALVGWAVRAMDGPFIPYSAAQKVLEAVDDDPAAFEGVPGVEKLGDAVRYYEAASAKDQPKANDRLRKLLLDLASRLGVSK